MGRPRTWGAPPGCPVQQGHEDLLQAGRGEVQHLPSAGCLRQRPKDHRRTGERPLLDSGDSRTPRSALAVSLAAIARLPEDRVAGELYPARRTSRPRRRGLTGRHDRVATLDCAAGKRTTTSSAPASSGKTSLMHTGADRPGQARPGQDPGHNHQDPVMTAYTPGGDLDRWRRLTRPPGDVPQIQPAIPLFQTTSDRPLKPSPAPGEGRTNLS